jgi:hypothetical protein
MTHIWFRQASDVQNHPRGPYATAEIRSSYAHHPLSSFSRLQGSINDFYRGWDPGIFLGSFPFSAIIISSETDEIPASPLPVHRVSHPSDRSTIARNNLPFYSTRLALRGYRPTEFYPDNDRRRSSRQTCLYAVTPSSRLPSWTGQRSLRLHHRSLPVLGDAFQTPGPSSSCNDRLSS